MLRNFISIIGLFFFLAACQHGPHASDARKVATTAPAVEEKAQWIAHPCGDQIGKPYRKYGQFLFGQGKVRAKLRSNGKESEIAGEWESLKAFFDKAGITAACGEAIAAVPTAPEQPSAPVTMPTTQKPKKESKPVKFTTPINEIADDYYAPMPASLTNDGNALRAELKKLLNADHVQRKNTKDRLVESCKTANLEKDEVCVSPIHQNYEQARRQMFGDIDLRKKEDGSYEVFDAYCQAWLDKEAFEKGGVNTDFPGPNQIVHSKVMNCEHTWPQSKFTVPKNEPENEIQKTDLHHLFSTSSQLNNIRSNFEFGEVDMSAQGLKYGNCLGARSEGVLGPREAIKDINEPIQTVFEPPAAHKGNVARALFYFATRFGAKMSASQEYFLRQWHTNDPVDEAEKQRNIRIYQLGGTRNPFIDHPEWVQSIPSFSK